MSEDSLIFVYGSLKHGFALHHLLRHQTFLGVATTAPVYRLFDLGEYPGLVMAAADGVGTDSGQPQGCGIEGEVYAVTRECLSRLDDVEGVTEGLYDRHPVRLEEAELCGTELAAGRTVWAWFYLQSVRGRPDCGSRWPCR